MAWTSTPARGARGSRGIYRFGTGIVAVLVLALLPDVAIRFKQAPGDRVYLSISYGRANRSLIVVYRNPIGEDAHKLVALRSGDKVPLWFLDGRNYIGEIDFPPMSEGIVMIGEQLAVLSESGAKKYQSGGKGPLDRIVFLDVSRFK